MPPLVSDIRKYVAVNVRWLGSLRRVWGSVAVVIAAATIAAVLPGKAEDQIRYCGLALQLLGVGTVVALLQDKTKTFGRFGLLAHLRERLSARPRFRPRPQIISASGVSASTAVGSAHASVWRSPNASASTDERLSMLEGNAETLRQDLEWHGQQARQAAERLGAELNTERQVRQSSVSAVEQRLDKFGAGGLHIEAAGLFWLVLGIVLATIPAELAWLLGLK